MVLNKKCLITSKNSLYKSSKDVDIYYIEDYTGFGNVKEASILTDKIYKSNPNFIQKYDYEGYKVTWSWYDQVYQKCLHYTQIKDLLMKLESLNYKVIEIHEIYPPYERIFNHYFFNKKIKTRRGNNIQNNIKQFIINILLLLFTIISMGYFFFRNKKAIGIRTEDMIFKGTSSDFRLNHLYDKLNVKKTNYIEFIRTKSLYTFFKNTFIRRRFAIYYDSITYFASLLTKKSVSLTPTSFYEAVLFSTSFSNEVLINSIKYIEKILKICKIDKIIILSFSSRTALISIAAKSLNIKTIGIMHGLSIKEQMAYEFMDSYTEDKKIGPDIYGVWSNDWVKYFHNYCKITLAKNIVHSGLLRPLDKFSQKPFSPISKYKIKVLIISEPLVSVQEMLPFLSKIIECDDFEVGIKIRPMIKDCYYEELKRVYPKILECPKYDGKIFDDGEKFDVFIGSYSTAVIEASLMSKLSILIRTEKWEDYFGMTSLLDNFNLLIDSPENICSEIKHRVKNEDKFNTINQIRTKFFGDNKDGVDWIIKELI